MMAPSYSYASGPSNGDTSYTTSRTTYLARLPSGGASNATPERRTSSSHASASGSSPVKPRRRPRTSAYDTFDEVSFCDDLAAKIAAGLAARPTTRVRPTTIDPWRGSRAAGARLEDAGVQTQEPEATGIAAGRESDNEDIVPDRTEATKAAAEAFLQRLQERQAAEQNAAEPGEEKLEEQVFAVFGEPPAAQDEIRVSAHDEEEEAEVSPHVEAQIASLLHKRNGTHDAAAGSSLIQEVMPFSVFDSSEEDQLQSSSNDVVYYEEKQSHAGVATQQDGDVSEDVEQSEEEELDDESDDEITGTDDEDEDEEDESEEDGSPTYDDIYYQPPPSSQARGQQEQPIDLLDSDDEKEIPPARPQLQRGDYGEEHDEDELDEDEGDEDSDEDEGVYEEEGDEAVGRGAQTTYSYEDVEDDEAGSIEEQGREEALYENRAAHNVEIDMDEEDEADIESHPSSGHAQPENDHFAALEAFSNGIASHYLWDNVGAPEAGSSEAAASDVFSRNMFDQPFATLQEPVPAEQHWPSAVSSGIAEASSSIPGVVPPPPLVALDMQAAANGEALLELKEQVNNSDDVRVQSRRTSLSPAVATSVGVAAAQVDSDVHLTAIVEERSPLLAQEMQPNANEDALLELDEDGKPRFADDDVMPSQPTLHSAVVEAIAQPEAEHEAVEDQLAEEEENIGEVVQEEHMPVLRQPEAGAIEEVEEAEDRSADVSASVVEDEQEQGEQVNEVAAKEAAANEDVQPQAQTHQEQEEAVVDAMQVDEEEAGEEIHDGAAAEEEVQRLDVVIALDAASPPTHLVPPPVATDMQAATDGEELIGLKEQVSSLVDDDGLANRPSRQTSVDVVAPASVASPPPPVTPAKVEHHGDASVSSSRRRPRHSHPDALNDEADYIPDDKRRRLRRSRTRSPAPSSGKKHDASTAGHAGIGNALFDTSILEESEGEADGASVSPTPATQGGGVRADDPDVEHVSSAGTPRKTEQAKREKKKALKKLYDRRRRRSARGEGSTVDSSSAAGGEEGGEEGKTSQESGLMTRSQYRVQAKEGGGGGAEPKQQREAEEQDGEQQAEVERQKRTRVSKRKQSEPPASEHVGQDADEGGGVTTRGQHRRSRSVTEDADKVKAAVEDGVTTRRQARARTRTAESEEGGGEAVETRTRRRMRKATEEAEDEAERVSADEEEQPSAAKRPRRSTRKL